MSEPLVICANCGAANLPGSRFCSTCAAPMESAAPGAETRKTVTVLFIDATSSTSLGEQLDPESMRALMTRYFDVMRDTIELHGGSVEKFIGDAVMAVFGVPVVHEDDALRACRSAVAIRDRLRELESEIRAEQGVTIEWRMGINTGEVVAGDGATSQRMVTGDAVNVAARLEAAANPGEILMGAGTHTLVRDLVTAEAVPPLTLKGKAQPMAAWRLDGIQTAVGRGQRHLEAPLIGRRRPMKLLEQAYEEAVEERVCHLFTVLGVAGVGKSRLVDEFVATVGDNAQLAVGRCLAYGHGITYWPVVEAIRHGAGIAESDATEVASDRLRTVLSDEPDAERIMAVVGNLLGLIDMPPAPDEIFWGIRRIFEGLARQRPLVLVFDDIHWGEPTFLDLIDHIADWTRDAPILLVAMARPELLEKRPAWGGGKRSATTLQLEPLSETESEELVTSLLGRADLPEVVRDQIRRAAEGNPLFVEELIGKLIDDGFLVETGDGWHARGDVGQLSVPATIQALLAARLDGLGPEERAVIERGAVEGKTFHRGAVTALAPEPMRGSVRDRLSTLLRMELLRPDQASFSGEEAYRFRHLLIRDAAYQALAKQTRAELHERFAGWLERAASERLAEYEEIIAYHLEQAYRYRVDLGPPDAHTVELAARAGTLLAVAAQRAGDRGDAAAAAALLDRVLLLLPAESPDRLLTIGKVGYWLLLAGEGPRAEALLTEALGDARRVANERAAAWIELSLTWVRNSTASIGGQELLTDAERLRDRFADLGDREGTDMAELTGAMSLFFLGRAAEAQARAQTVADSGNPSPLVQADAARWAGASTVFGPFSVGEAIRVLGQARPVPGRELGMARLLILQGSVSEARHHADLGATQAMEIGDRMLLSQADEIRAEISLAEGDVAEAVRWNQAAYDGKVALGDRGFASTTAVNLAEKLIVAGDWEQAEHYGRIALETSAHDDIASQAGGRSVLARVHAWRGEHQEAERLGREAVAILASTDYLDEHGDALVHLAHAIHAAGRVDAAREAAQEAIALYRQKEATLLVERTERLLAGWGG